MSLAAVLLTPFALLFSAMGVTGARDRHEVPAAAVGKNPVRRPDLSGSAPAEPRGWVFGEVAESFRIQAQNQVRIEQHLTIRVTPLSRPVTMPPQFLLDLPRRELSPRLTERNIGRCLPVAGISGVQPDQGRRLILFLRDRRMISAVLERACRARDFYSGFYIERTSDGQLCVDRDTLLSRSGANCKLTRIRQLIEPDD
ncbi:MAG: hypothetical protein JF595_02975 [Sphingomonadales bacterium]|nr:hypothetical protein [Sphingomonadales bacterium]